MKTTLYIIQCNFGYQNFWSQFNVTTRKKDALKNLRYYRKNLNSPNYKYRLIQMTETIKTTRKVLEY